MKSNTSFPRRKVAPIMLFLALALAGCGTTDSARELAKVTGENVGSLSGQLQVLESASKRVAKRRADTLILSQDAAASTRARAATKVQAMRIANPAKRELVERVLGGLREVAVHQEAERAAHADRITTLLAARTPLVPPTTELTALATTLQELSAETSIVDRAKTLGELAKEIAKAWKDAKKSSAQAAEDAVAGTLATAAAVTAAAPTVNE